METTGGNGSEIVSVEVDLLERGEVGQGRKRTAEGVSLERESDELREGVEIGGEFTGEGLVGEVDGVDAAGVVALHALPRGAEAGGVGPGRRRQRREGVAEGGHDGSVIGGGEGEEEKEGGKEAERES